MITMQHFCFNHFDWISDGLCFFHDNLGISWWACIVGSSILLRVFFMGPANIVSQKVSPGGVARFSRKGPLSTLANNSPLLLTFFVQIQLNLHPPMSLLILNL